MAPLSVRNLGASGQQKTRQPLYLTEHIRRHGSMQKVEATHLFTIWKQKMNAMCTYLHVCACIFNTNLHVYVLIFRE